ncbi:Helicase associated domain protein [Arthrobacter sp. UYCo732]|uniref:Helicase associated domain protein n=1 Tax=Arthrobacter sp. UYCo732 TaxID=3156336 RepID=UPI00339ACB20
MTPATPRRTAAESLEALHWFQQEHGRLPKANATDRAEKTLANFLFGTVRSRERRGTLLTDLREQAARIPGALTLDTHPDQDEVFADLKSFIADTGHAPRHTRTGVPAREVRLRAWISNNVYGDPATKTPRLRARHEAIVNLLTATPSYAEKNLDERITAAEQFVRENGYRPSGRDMSWLTEYVQGKYLLSGPFGAESQLNDIRAARLKSIIASPSLVEHRWNENLAALTKYAAGHSGTLPGNWSHPLFGWLTVQRREYRHGRLSQARERVLRGIPGVLPQERRLAEAA